MYKFVDPVTGVGTGSTILSLNTVFNGVNLDEELTDDNGSFTTLSVSGRGILTRRINITEIPGIHGVREKGYTYDLREITVTYRLKDKTNEGFRERFNRLNELLLGNKKRLEFTDEDAFFIASLRNGDTPDEDSNDIIGTLVFVCTDPAKRKNTFNLNILTSFQTFTISGQTETPWNVEVNFTEPASTFELETNKGLYLLLQYDFISGDNLIINYDGREVWLNGEDLRHAVRLKTNYQMLEPGEISIKASHQCTLKYDERYY